MGCDIHLYKEKHVDGKWLAADEWKECEYVDGYKSIEVPWENRFTDRNYQLFGMLSKGVRFEHDFSFEPRGLPFNLCAEIAAEAKRWEGDGHGHSYLYLHELKDMLSHLEQTTIKISGMKHRDELKVLHESISSGSPNWDLIFPYCRSTNAPGYEDFEIEIPASFYMGGSLRKIIAGFDGVDGDNHRIVFFFDN